MTGPLRLNVENGVVTAFTMLPGSSAAGGTPEPADFPTIDDLFARLRAEVRRGMLDFRGVTTIGRAEAPGRGPFASFSSGVRYIGHEYGIYDTTTEAED